MYEQRTTPVNSNILGRTFEPLRGVYPCAPFGSSPVWREEVSNMLVRHQVYCEIAKTAVEGCYLLYSDGESSVRHKLDFHLLFFLLERQKDWMSQNKNTHSCRLRLSLKYLKVLKSSLSTSSCCASPPSSSSSPPVLPSKAVPCWQWNIKNRIMLTF